MITDAIMAQFTKPGIAYSAEQFPWYFPSIAEYTALMEVAGFRVVLAQHVDRPTPLDGEDGLTNWLNMFGDHFFAHLNNIQKK